MLVNFELEFDPSECKVCVCSIFFKCSVYLKTAGHELFDWTEGDFNAEESFASAEALSGSLLAGPLADVGVLFSHSRNVTVKFEDLSTACVDKDKLVEYVTSKEWQPNVDDPRLDWPDPTKCVPISGRQAPREATFNSHFPLLIQDFSRN